MQACSGSTQTSNILLFTSKQHAQDLHLNVVIITETFCNIIPLFWYLQKQLFTSVLVASDGFLPCCYKIKWIVVKYLMHCVELNTPFLSLKKRISDIKVVTYCLRVEIAISRRLAYLNYVLTLKWMSQLLLVTYY